MPDKNFISFQTPQLGRKEIDAVARVLKSGWLTSGPETARFEDEFRQYVGARYALAVNSATAGLHLSLAALGIGPGDEVITTPLTFCATVNSILHVGATPVLADIDDHLNVDPACVERAITERTRAILPVHFAGAPCNMEKLWELARSHNLMVVEDAAHAAGATFDGMPVGGGKSHSVVFSFYATKNITTGEGGMVTTPYEELWDKMRILCLHGMSQEAWGRYAKGGNWKYDVVMCGFKYNMGDIASALGRVQLEKIAAITSRRREIAAIYTSAFSDLPELQTPIDVPGHCWHLYVLRLNLRMLRIDRSEFIEEMRAGASAVACTSFRFRCIRIIKR